MEEAPFRRPPPGPARERRSPLEKLFPALALLAMFAAIPQAWSVWVESDTEGLRLLSWAASCLCVDALVVVGLLWQV